MFQRFNRAVVTLVGVFLCFFVLAAVNYNFLQPQSALAIFVGLGTALCFLAYPFFDRAEEGRTLTPGGSALGVLTKGKLLLPAGPADVLRLIDIFLAAAAVLLFGYVFMRTEPLAVFQWMWPTDAADNPIAMGQKAGEETSLDIAVAWIGLVLVLEATRRAIGAVVPLLAIVFMVHAYFAPELPEWLIDHRGKSVAELATDTFLPGVLGPAARVMFQYVFLFVVFGAFLEMSGATQFIIDFSDRLFGKSAGGPAKVAVLGSGLMGSLSGSAVANAVTTGSFTIPMMRSSGFKPHVAGGITAAAAAGGALVPPVMGAGAYMILEFAKRDPGQPEIIFLEVAKAALIPALLYYLSIFWIVHFQSRRISVADAAPQKPPQRAPISKFNAAAFFGALGVLVGLLLIGLSPFKSVTGSLVYILVLSIFRRELQLGMGARLVAVGVFAGVFLLHQLTIFIPGVPGWAAPFVANTWIGVDSGLPTFSKSLQSLVDSCIMGMFGLLVVGLVIPSWRPEIVKAFSKSSRNGIALIAASACVGIIIGIVNSTPMAQAFSDAIKDVVETNLLLALIGIMFASLVMGMGVPSVVCYLLLATLMGALLKEMGVDPLAAHLFIFYYGMMSMVTPPVALAAYASASIAEARIMPTAVAAFRYSLVGFALPFMFVYRPELLLMGPHAEALAWADAPRVVWVVLVCVLGVTSLAVSVTGYMFKRTVISRRIYFTLAALLLVMPNVTAHVIQFGFWQFPVMIPAMFLNIVGVLFFAYGAVANYRWGIPDPPAARATL